MTKLLTTSSWVLSASLILCIAAISVPDLNSRKTSHNFDTKRCTRLCHLQEMHTRLPCDIRECYLQQCNHKALHQILTNAGLNDQVYSKSQRPFPLAIAQKRVKEVWEGPAPADVNH